MSDEQNTNLDEAVPVSTTDAVPQMLANELLIYLPKLSVSLHLNECMSLIWLMCDGKKNISQITSELQEAYPEANKDIEIDVTQAIYALAQNGAVTLE